MSKVTFNQTKAYGRLQAHAAQMKQAHLRDMFAKDPKRAQAMAVTTPHVFYDYSRQRVTPETMGMLVDLANERGLKPKIEAMFTGKKINVTEGRAVLHTALRNLAFSGKPVFVDDKMIMADVKKVLDNIKDFSNKVLSGSFTGATGKCIKNIVSVGIGGSYLGPEYLAVACRAYAKEGMNLVFVANVDPTDFAQKTAGLDPEETLFIIESKTFTTSETMKNAEIAKQWVMDHYKAHVPNFFDLGSEKVINSHFVAVSTAKEKVKAFGINPYTSMFGFWDWVGGRYSATSAIGAVPLSLYLGFDNFWKILEGAQWMDLHFRNTPFEQNIPVLSALIDVWNINFMEWYSRALLPYSQALAKLPAHTQQVEMESNGKSVDIDGNPIDFKTGEVVFGEPGTNGQHSFYQLIHQGTNIIPCDFIGFIQPQYPLGTASATSASMHQELMTNFLAQPDALAFGKDSTDPARNFPGNRPSSSTLLSKQGPFEAGLLLALTEHRAAVKGFIWNIDSFDQFGVELGKVLGVDQRDRMLGFNATGTVNAEGLNPSTAMMLTAILTGKLPR